MVMYTIKQKIKALNDAISIGNLQSSEINNVKFETLKDWKKQFYRFCRENSLEINSKKSVEIFVTKKSKNNNYLQKENNSDDIRKYKLEYEKLEYRNYLLDSQVKALSEKNSLLECKVAQLNSINEKLNIQIGFLIKKLENLTIISNQLLKELNR